MTIQEMMDRIIELEKRVKKLEENCPIEDEVQDCENCKYNRYSDDEHCEDCMRLSGNTEIFDHWEKYDEN